MRAFRVMSIPDILQYLRLLKSPYNIRFAQLLSILTSILLAAAGIIQLVCIINIYLLKKELLNQLSSTHFIYHIFQLEICGDFKVDFPTPGTETYWDSFYLVMITMSTVGFGDVTCKTVSGRMFICFFILTTLVIIIYIWIIY